MPLLYHRPLKKPFTSSTGRNTLNWTYSNQPNSTSNTTFSLLGRIIEHPQNRQLRYFTILRTTSYPGGIVNTRNKSGERLGGETSGPLFMQCVMRSRTGTSAPSALPVRFQSANIFLSTNRKSHFLYLKISQECVMIKQLFNSLIF